MNTLFALLVAISSWMVFATLNELASASAAGGCCANKSCGKSFFDGIFWWSNMVVAIAFTIYVLYDLNDQFNPYMKEGKLVGALPSALKMVFGN